MTSGRVVEFTKEQMEAIAKETQGGARMADVAKRYGCGRETLRRRLNAFLGESREEVRARHKAHQDFVALGKEDAEYRLGLMRGYRLALAHVQLYGDARAREHWGRLRIWAERGEDYMPPGITPPGKRRVIPEPSGNWALPEEKDAWGQTYGRCPDCGMPRQSVRPGKGQPACECNA